jgi:hypothetical protein
MSVKNPLIKILEDAFPLLEYDTGLNSFKGFLKVLLISIIQFSIIIVVFPLTFEISDDYFMNAIASGALSGTPSEFLMFTNVLIGKLLVWLYSIMPSINWYTFYLLTTLFAGYTAIQFSFYRLKTDFSIRIFRHLMILALFLYSLHTSGFTLTATIAATGGFLLILTSSRSMKISIFCGLALVVLAALIRNYIFYMMFLIILPLSAIALLKRRYIQTSAVLLTALLALIAIKFDQKMYAKSPGFSEFRAIGSLSSKLYFNNNRYINYDDMSENLEKLGWDETEYGIISRSLYDPNNELFYKDNLKLLIPSSGTKQDKWNRSGMINSLKPAVRSFWKYLVSRYNVFLVVLIVAIIFVGRQKSRFGAFLLFSLYIMLIGFWLYHFKDGELKNRVLFGMSTAPALLILFYLDQKGKLPTKIAFLDGVKAPYIKHLIMTIAIICLAITLQLHVQRSSFISTVRYRVHHYQQYIASQNHQFYAQRVIFNPYYIRKNPFDMSNAYQFGWLLGSPFNREKIERYTGVKNVDIYSIRNQEIIWYFGERLHSEEGPLITEFYKSLHPNCNIQHDTILVENRYNLYRYTFYIPDFEHREEDTNTVN